MDTVTSDGSVAVHMLISLATAVAEIKAHMTKIGEEQASQRDMLTRFDERQI